MRQSRPSVTDDGSAALEFITAGVLLLVPLVYLVVAMAAIQAGALAVEGASRQAARVYVEAPTPAAATSRAETAVAFALSDFGLSTSSAKVSIECSRSTARCLDRGNLVTVTVSARVSLPLAPPAFGGSSPLSIPLTATSTEQVSRFWGAG